MRTKLNMLDFEDAKAIYNLQPSVGKNWFNADTFAETSIQLERMLGPWQN